MGWGWLGPSTVFVASAPSYYTLPLSLEEMTAVWRLFSLNMRLLLATKPPGLNTSRSESSSLLINITPTQKEKLLHAIRKVTHKNNNLKTVTKHPLLPINIETPKRLPTTHLRRNEQHTPVLPHVPKSLQRFLDRHPRRRSCLVRVRVRVDDNLCSLFQENGPWGRGRSRQSMVTRMKRSSQVRPFLVHELCARPDRDVPEVDLSYLSLRPRLVRWCWGEPDDSDRLHAWIRVRGFCFRRRRRRRRKRRRSGTEFLRGSSIVVIRMVPFVVFFKAPFAGIVDDGSGGRGCRMQQRPYDFFVFSVLLCLYARFVKNVRSAGHPEVRVGTDENPLSIKDLDTRRGRLWEDIVSGALQHAQLWRFSKDLVATGPSSRHRSRSLRSVCVGSERWCRRG
ncbi:hypothetical protein BXZ70DRAFT_949524 [Cristinia sonorae]|uniref:Uncharacterized protein n=1 Tax=Cristinia sonorae TaxID=1940300 RepID=A0A8K0UKN0_9AGAR|nr:hypothetical protein BXZ70DRAFT_949524 [Cristinia sonorae]